ncbi:phosphopantetheine-binding protein [uncultured Winogradskyella sp.]|uniref:phosphopantetheine-binding protein n=1 Tax=uncultured Winogradskyella sp. TaxID=395353 RepID=UPI0026330DC8|nr:phosphopantetheine-binding protein [uncultured Winogradskyella sp.]
MEKIILHLLSEIRPEFDFSESSNFIAEGLLDSFDIVQLVTALDEAYNISIDGLDILPENFSNLEAIKATLIKNGATT